ncbi:MAG: CoA pyrophosphatase [Alphaproteobacteria bacterium]|nr:MAG: CoA pyrophosphatase [Alphaproteobacteria bacterium]
MSADNPAARGRRSDYDLNGTAKAEFLKDVTLRQAAVLVPIVERANAYTILLTKRTEHLPKHAGQVSFPGGAVDPADRDAVDAALREAEEEIGLNRSYVDVCGFLDEYRTGTGFSITPVVALVRPGFTITLQPDEVDSAFEVPFDFLMDRRNHKRQSAFWKGQMREYYAMPYMDYHIWGATAAMLVNLCDVLDAVQETTP